MIWWMIATLCSYFVKGMCGFANTLIFTGILGFTVNNIDITPVDLILAYPSNVIIAWKERKQIQLKLVLPVVILVVAGVVPGVMFLKNVDATILKIICGVVITGMGVELYWKEFTSSKKKLPKGILLILAILSGLLCALYGIGALLAVYMGEVTEDSHAFKANLCCVFTIENTCRILLYCVLGILNFQVLVRALMLAPVMLAALFAGMYCSKKLNEKIVKRIVIIMLIITGIMLVINNI